VLASLIVLLVVGHSQRTYGASALGHIAHLKQGSVTSYDDTKIITTCDRLQPQASLGLSKPTLVSRIDGVDAIVFATGTKFSACIIYDPKNVAANKPTPFVHSSAAVDELQSFGTLNKVPGRDKYASDTWFLVRVNPSVTTLRAVTRGTSQSSKITDGFAFIHVQETADILGKFAYGVTAGFRAGGSVVGSATLR
jgi:hypothetical protein